MQEKEEVLVLDLETTGVSKYKHKITEICAQFYVDGKLKSEFHRYLKAIPSDRAAISLGALKVTKTNLKSTMMEGDDEGETLMGFVDWLLTLSDKRIQILGHSVGFDYGFIEQTLLLFNVEDLGEVISRRFEDTLILAKTMQKVGLIPEGSLALGSLAAMLDVPIPKGQMLHSAKTDCIVTFGVYNKLRSILEGK